MVGDAPAHLLPWVHRVFANAKRWALGVYHGLREEHLQAYLDEFVFRFNPPHPQAPQPGFARLVEQAVRTKPAADRGQSSTRPAPPRLFRQYGNFGSGICGLIVSTSLVGIRTSMEETCAEELAVVRVLARDVPSPGALADEAEATLRAGLE